MEQMKIGHAIKIMLAVIIFGTAIFAVSFFYSKRVPEEPKPQKAERGQPASAWREDFSAADGMTGWVKKPKPGTRQAVFSVVTDPDTGDSFLHMEADSASSSLVTRIEGIDIEKTPILRWRWRVNRLPDGADGRQKAKDDQAIGIYAGSGSMLNNKSVSYRWDTLTPLGSEGNCAYGLGTVKVRWHTLRNDKDSPGETWFIEERNLAEDFKNAWGYYPKDVYISVSCNSQYTGSRASADLDWIELDSQN